MRKDPPVSRCMTNVRSFPQGQGPAVLSPDQQARLRGPDLPGLASGPPSQVLDRVCETERGQWDKSLPEARISSLGLI